MFEAAASCAMCTFQTDQIASHVKDSTFRRHISLRVS